MYAAQRSEQLLSKQSKTPGSFVTRLLLCRYQGSTQESTSGRQVPAKDIADKERNEKEQSEAATLPHLTDTLFSTPAFAEVKAISRANCVIGIVNESITYDRPQLRPFNGSVTSTHTQLGNTIPLHSLVDVGYGKWRYYAGDIEDPGTLRVDGTHYWLVVDPNGQIVESGQEATSATDCNITEW